MTTNDDALTKSIQEFQNTMAEGGPEVNPDTCFESAMNLWRSGNLDGAEAMFLQGLHQQSSHIMLCHGLAELYLSVGQWAAAEPHLLTGLSVEPNHLKMLVQMGLVHFYKKDYLAARKYYLKALEIDPHFMQAREDLDLLFKGVVPEWHFSMMNDEGRNHAYDAAIRAAVTPDTIVLEIGTGAGLLAMMAARAGAKHVYTVEMVEVIAQTAREIIAANGYSDRITVIEKNAFDLNIGEDLPEQADLLITEIFDAGFLGEGAVPSIQHARDFLLKPQAAIIPESGTVYGALIDSPTLWRESAVNTACGFDVSVFNRFQEIKSAKYLSYYPHEAVSDDFEIFHFNFCGPAIVPERKTIRVDAAKPGTCHLIAYWFRLQLDGQHYLETKVGNNSCWRQGSQIIDPPVELKAEDNLSILAEHNCRWIRLRLS